MSLQAEGIHLLVGDLDAGRVECRHQMGLDLESGLSLGLPNVVQREIKRA